MQYAREKELLLGILKDLAEMAVGKGNTAAHELLSEARERLENETITLVVLGEFKRGKSTFINALLGEQLLPTAIVPLTAIPTVIEYGPNTGAKVIFENGTVRAIEAGQIPEYVTERYNPENTKGVREVQMTHPAPYLRQGIILVDTPGVGSVYAHNTDAAYAYLPRADAGVFVISVDAPLGRTEVDYLRDIQKYVHKFIFVLNKVDIAGEEDIQEAMDFARRTLVESTGIEHPHLVPLSSKLALEGKTLDDPGKYARSHMADLEQLLNAVISKEKTALVLSAAAAKGLRILNEFQLELDLWRRGMDDSLEDLERKAESFNAELKNLDQEREDSIYLLYREVEKLTGQVTARMQDFEKTSRQALIERLDQFIEQIWDDYPVKRAVELAQDHTRDITRGVLREQRIRLRESIKDDFERISNRFFDRIEDIVDRMMDISAEIFDVPVQKTRYKDYVLEHRYFYFHFRDHPTFIPSLEELTVTALLPKGLLKNKIKAKARDHLTELLSRNCGRVRVDIVSGLTERVREVAGDLRLRADAVGLGLGKAVEKVLDEKRAGDIDRDRASQIAAKENERLARLRETLDPLVGR